MDQVLIDIRRNGTRRKKLDAQQIDDASGCNRADQNATHTKYSILAKCCRFTYELHKQTSRILRYDTLAKGCEPDKGIHFLPSVMHKIIAAAHLLSNNNPKTLIKEAL
jgi:hypothetical protein